MGSICPFGVFFSCFIVFFASKFAIFPSNVVFWKLEKAIFGPEKDKWWIRRSMPIKLGKTSQHRNWPRYMDWPQIGPKIAIKQGKKRQKDKWYPIRAPTSPPSPEGTEVCTPLRAHSLISDSGAKAAKSLGFIVISGADSAKSLQFIVSISGAQAAKLWFSSDFRCANCRSNCKCLGLTISQVHHLFQ